MRRDSVEDGWRPGLSEKAIAQIRSAISQARLDIAYEESAPTVGETLRTLKVISDSSAQLSEAIHALSTVGMSYIWEGSRPRGRTMGRLEVNTLLLALDDIGVGANFGREMLRKSHSPMPETGQGSGSAEGRDPDLRSVRVAGTNIRPFRTPEDKFAVAVLRALVGDHHPAVASQYYGQRKELGELLSAVWSSGGLRGDPKWANILPARKTIIAQAVAKLARHARRSQVAENNENDPPNSTEDKCMSESSDT